MKHILIPFLFSFQFAIAQNMNSVWVFGDSAGINFVNINNPVAFSTGIDSRGTCTSIADSVGNLSIYAFTRSGNFNHSTLVYNGLNQLIQYGDSIVGEGWYNEEIIVPKPDVIGLYHLFHIGITYPNTQGLYYSLIDINANGGLGSVIQKNIQLNNFRNADCLTAIKHGNGRDWWIFSKYSTNIGTTFNRFYIYLVTPDSIYPPLIQDLNDVSDVDVQRIIFNSDGTKFMQINFNGFMCEYDFDRCTGMISNPNLIFPEQLGNYSRFFWSGAYSPDNGKFYVNTNLISLSITDTCWLIQFDLNAANIPASADSLHYSIYPVNDATLRLAPDNKIYYTTNYAWGFPGYPYPDSVYNQYNMNLSVINSPNSPGAACNFQPYSFNLGGKRSYYGLPNNPNYGMPPLYGSACDSLSAGINSPPTPPQGGGVMFVSYIKVWEKAFINAQYLKGTTYTLRITDITGRQVFKQSGKLQPPYFTKDLDCNGFSNGMYIVTLITNKEQLSQKFIKN